MEYKTPTSPDSDALAHAPTFDEMVELIEKNFKDVLELSGITEPDRIADAWRRYKILNHLYQDQPPSTTQGAVWYTEQEMYNYLIQNHYSEEVAKELAKDWAKSFQGAYEKGKQHSDQQKGAVWVKGMPVVGGTYHVNYRSGLKGTVFFDINSDVSIKHWELNIESFLDESTPSKEEDIEFTRWVSVNLRWIEPYKHWLAADGKVYLDELLPQLYQQSKTTK
jgi:hypothetical protein